MEAVFEKVKALHCEKYSGCLFCWAPQAVCHLWEEKHVTSGTRTTAFQRCQGGRCQYPKLVLQVVAAVVSQRMGDLTDQEEWLWVQEEMQKIPGFWDASSEESKRWDLLWKWLGLKKVSNSIEMSCMVQMIYYLG